MLRIRQWMLSIIILSWGICYANTSLEIQTQSLKSNTRFITWQGIEPDKRATLWLIKRHITPDAYFVLMPPNSDLPNNAYAFGVPKSSLRRANRESKFRRLKQAMSLDSKLLSYTDEFTSSVEVNFSGFAPHPQIAYFSSHITQITSLLGVGEVLFE